jgi:hypothetical protein
MEDRWVRRVAISAIVVAVLAASFFPIEPSGTAGGPGSISGNAAPTPLTLPADLARASSAGTDIEVAPAYSPAPGVVTIGPVPASLPITVDVGLAPPAPSALAGLVSALYAPGTPEYHHFLSSPELAERFGPSPSTVAAAQAYFERFGPPEPRPALAHRDRSERRCGGGIRNVV